MKLLVLHGYLCAQKDNGMSIWESLAFLASKLINEEKIQQIEMASFSSLFEQYYSYKIPYHPLKTLFAKMVESKLLIQTEISLTPNYQTIKEYIKKNETSPVDLDIIVKNIWNYINDKKGSSIYTFSEIEEELLKYLKNNQYEIVNSIVNDYDFSITPKEEIQFYINSFIYEKISTNYEYKNLILDLIIANINLSSIFFEEVSDSISINCKIYLDTRIILRLMGVEGEYRKTEYKDFLNKLKDIGYELCVFDCHYDEIESNIQESITCVSDTTNFKIELASPLSCYFYNNHLSPSKMALFQYELDSILQEYSITKESTDYENEENNKFNIDETTLYSFIDKEYKGSGSNKLDFDDPKIWTDIKAISTIYRLRQGKKETDLEKVDFIFLTSNSALSRANKNYKINENQKYNKFQECLTDTFLGSYLWIQSNKDLGFVKKRLLSASYEYIQATPEIKKSFIEIIEKKKDLKPNQYKWLRSLVGKDSSKIALKSCNIVDNLLDSTPEELLREHDEEIRRQVQNEADKKIEHVTSLYDSAKEQSDNLQNTVDKQNLEKEETIQSIIEDAERKAKRDSILIGIFCGLVLVTDFILKFTTNIPLWVIILVGAFMLIITVLSLYFGFTVKGFTKKLKEKNINKICTKFKIKYSPEN